MRRPLKAVIFDFDGLIMDSESPAFAAWSEIYQEHGVELALAKWVACVGSTYSVFDPVAHLTELTGRAFERDKLLEAKEQRKASICDTLPALPGVRARIYEAQALGLKLAVASSSPSAWVVRHLRRLSLYDLFQVVCTREDVLRVKPHPDLYLEAAKKLEVKPESCLVFEDSLNGVLAAKAAGAFCYAIPNTVTCQLDFSQADGVFPSLDSVSLAAWPI